MAYSYNFGVVFQANLHWIDLCYWVLTGVACYILWAYIFKYISRFPLCFKLQTTNNNNINLKNNIWSQEMQLAT